MDISLNVSGYDIELGMRLDSGGLARAGIRKMVFFSGMVMPIPKLDGDVIYWSKNPTINCFSRKVTAFAMLDRSAGADMMCGTSLYLFFNNGVLRYVIAQVISNPYAASMFTESLRKVAEIDLGKPARRTSQTWEWVADGQTFISEMGQSKKNGFMHWKLS